MQPRTGILLSALVLIFCSFCCGQRYQLAELIPYQWIEIGPNSLTPGTEFVVNTTCYNLTFNPPAYFYGTNYSWALVSKHGYLSFPPGATCVSSTLNTQFKPQSQCPYPLTDVGTGICMFYAFTTQQPNAAATPRQFYKYFPTCPYAGLGNTNCHVVEFIQSQWALPAGAAFAITVETIIGGTGAVITQYLDQNLNVWLGAIIGVGSTAGSGDSATYPRPDGHCEWANYSTPLDLRGKAFAFYPLNQNAPCDSDHNVTVNTGSARGCTCEDFDGDSYRCPENDACPFDGTKWLDSGVCGCDVSDVDTDQDGYSDCIDSCPSDPKKWLSPGLCGCGNEDYLPGTYSLACGSSASSLHSWLDLF